MSEPQDDLIARTANVIAHEVRNPLAIVNNSAYYVKTKMKAKGWEDPGIQKHLGIIEAEVQSANGLIGQLLLFAKDRAPQPAPTAVNALLEQAVKADALPKGVRLELRLEASLAKTPLDAEMATRALRNLVANAADAMPEGGTIRVASSRRGKGELALEVSDSGPGVAEDLREKIFEPFYTTKARRLGLGLTVARKFVERMGGRLEIRGAEGKGAAFAIVLPAG